MLNRRHLSILLPAVLLVAALLLPADATAGFHLGSSRITTSYQYLDDMALGDLNGDGLTDAALVTNTEDWLLLIHLGQEDGAFGEESITVMDTEPFMVACGDMDNDGDNDLVTFSIGDNSYSDNFITVMLNDGTGSFPDREVLTLSPDNYEIRHARTADLNGDGNLDLAALDQDNVDGLFILLGAGDGTLAENGHYDAGAVALELVDLDGDGNLDAAVADGYGSSPENGSVDVLYGLGDGTFEETVKYPTFPSLRSLDSGDMDGDGHLDIVAVGGSYDDSNLLTLLARGDRTFMDPIYFEEGSLRWPSAMFVEDRTGDDVPDAVVLDSGNARILAGVGDGTFTMSRSHPVAEYTDGGCFEDINDDGKLDIVTRSSNPGCVSVMLSRASGSFAGCWSAVLDEDLYDEGGYCSSGDFSNDGIIDLVVCVGKTAIFTLTGNGDGTFQAPVVIYLPGNSREAAVADLDGDGDRDLLVACGGGSQGGYCTLTGNGDGTFGDPVFIDLDAGAYEVAVDHLDGDSHLDAVLNTSDGHLVIHGDGAGGFTLGQLATFTSGWGGSSLGDVDEDGDLDLALHASDPPALMVVYNNGSGVFSASTPYNADHYPIDSAIGDFDGDGHLDLVACMQYAENGNLFFGDGTGSFTVGPEFPVGLSPRNIEAGDMNGDGLDDLVVGTSQDSGDPYAICLLFSNGTGIEGPPEIYFAGTDAYMVHQFDADGDGDLDVAAHSIRHHSGVSVLLNSTGGLFFAAGPGAAEFNPSNVRTFDPFTGELRHEWASYGVARWGVNVALGELTGGGMPEVLSGAGPGPVFGPHVRGFESDGTPLPGVSFFAYGTLKYGVNVAAGDLDNDGFDEIVTGAGPGAVFGPHVRGWNWDGAGTPEPIPGISYFAYGTPKWGVNVSCGDIDGDGYDEIVTGAGPGAVYGPHVRGWNCDGGNASSIPGVSYFAYGTLKYGVNVSCGDIDGDGIDEIVTGAGPGAVFGPHVRAFNWDGSGTVESIPAVSFFAYGYTQWGANVSCGDLDADGIDEILTGPGPGPAHEPRVRGWNYDGQSLTAMSGVDFLAFNPVTVTSGVKVAGS